MENTLYEVEYAKSNNSLCKVCRQKISKGAVRIAILLQSAVCDKKIHHWHHESCFFKNRALRNVSEIRYFEKLLNNDQERIKAEIKISKAAAPVLPETSKIRKRNFQNANHDNHSIFLIEYAKTSRATCRCCDTKISKNCIRISKFHYDPRYGNIPMWYHVQCFIKKRHELLFFASGECIPGFNDLKPADQVIIKSEIKFVEDGVISKVLKQNNDIIAGEEHDQKVRHLTSSWKKKLNTLKKSELQILLQENNQDVCESKKDCINRLINYFNLQNAKTDKIRIPDVLQNHVIFKNFETANISLSGTEYESINNYPLKNLQFYLHGKLKTTKDKLKNRILGLGGLVLTKIIPTVAAVITTKEQLSKSSKIVENIKKDKIEVVEESFIDIISERNGTVIDSINQIIQHNIADWKSDPFKRIPQCVIDGKTVEKLGSIYQNFTSANASKLYVKYGIPIDSRSKLESNAHIYTDDEKIYSDSLVLANVNINKNSYYKLELWESNEKNQYWIFRAWGRIGTKIGKTKLISYTSIDAAKEMYLKIYENKTKKRRRSSRNIKITQDNCGKHMEGYVPIDLSYEDFKRASLKIDTDSKLPKSVQELVINIFDTEIMKKTLLQFELDIEKMPLGKLSASQIKTGYEVLSELMEQFNKNSASPEEIIEASNKFYTLIPHSVGTEALPLLDKPEIIKEKEEMLNSLLEIEVAYKLLQLPTDDSAIPIESHYLKLKTDICPVDKNDPDYHLLLSYVKNTHAPTHNNYELEVTDIFRVVREGEDERYEKYKQLHNRRLLWHGSRMTNLAGILSQGLRIAPPEAPQTGKMFGNGIYFADMSSKSANYCFADKTNSTGYIFVCEVALGGMYKCHKAKKVTELPKGTHSTWGVGQMEPDPLQNKILENGVIVPLGTPVETKAATRLLYNEFIVYDISQVNIKFLVQLKFKFKL